MTQNLRDKNLSLALRFIVERFGQDVLLNPNRVRSILMDLIPKSTMEINWIIDAINLGITKYMVNGENSNLLTREEIKRECISIFKEEHITDLRMNYILDNIYYAIGWSDKEVLGLKEYEEQYKSKTSKNKISKSKTYEENKFIQEEQQRVLNTNVSGEKTEIKKDKTILSKVESNNIEDTSLNKYIYNNRNRNNNNNNNKNNNNNNNKNNPNPKKRKKKKWVLLFLIPIILLIAGLAIKMPKQKENITISEYIFNVDYVVENNVYTFNLNEKVKLTPKLKGDNSEEIDNSKISYSIDDTSICMYTKEDGKLLFEGISDLGSTVIKIYYDTKEIGSINVAFKEKEESQEEEETETEENKEIEIETDKEVISNLNREDNNSEYDDEYDYEDDYSIEHDKIYAQYMVEDYLNNYGYAINNNDIGYVYDYITDEGSLYREVNGNIEATNKTGTKVYVDDYFIDDVEYEYDSGEFRVYTYVEYTLEKESGTYYQKEYLEFIVLDESYLIDRCENVEILENYEI